MNIDKNNTQLPQSSVSSGCFLEVIDKLPHSKSRVPYTYHHDYLRTNTEKFKFSSRSEIASIHTENDLELYAVSLIKILDDLGSNALKHINSKDVELCKKALEITDLVVSRYNHC